MLLVIPDVCRLSSIKSVWIILEERYYIMFKHVIILVKEENPLSYWIPLRTGQTPQNGNTDVDFCLAHSRWETQMRELDEKSRWKWSLVRKPRPGGIAYGCVSIAGVAGKYWLYEKYPDCWMLNYSNPDIDCGGAPEDCSLNSRFSIFC